ncbi:MAG: hypothetical protein AB8B69_21970, partial [Chitinophagales bacterium]
NIPNNYYPSHSTNWTSPSISIHDRNPSFKTSLTHGAAYTRIDWNKIIDTNKLINLSQNMGIKTEIDSSLSFHSFRGLSIKLYEVTAAYNSFNNRSQFIEPRTINCITDKNGMVLQKFTQQSHQVFDEDIGFQLLGIMEETVNKGISRRLRWKYKLKGVVAGQTGTTNNRSSGWFLGMIPQLTVGIWVGGKEPEVRFRSTRYGQGANMALPIFGEFITAVYADSTTNISPQTSFGIPDYIYEQLDCRTD